MNQTALNELIQKREMLIAGFLNKAEPDFLNQHARIFDAYFCSSAQNSPTGIQIVTSGKPYAVIALGGFGRMEQCVHSDIDLLFLFKDNVPDETEGLIQEMIYPLWDLSLEVGHATRSINECLAIARDDFEVLTSLMDARYICGDHGLYSDLMKRLRKKVIRPKSKKIGAWLIESSNNRHKRFGDSTYLLEPHLKEGQGGLRDYHTMLWMTHIKTGRKLHRGLEYDGYLSGDEFDALGQALSFVWNVRNRLHHMAGKRCDRLHFEYQVKLADIIEIENSDRHQPVERFLGMLHHKMELIKQQHLIVLSELMGDKKFGFIRNIFSRHSPIRGIHVKNNLLGFDSPEAVLQTPYLLLNIFEESLRLGLPLSARAKRIVKELSHLVDEKFRSSPATLDAFENILVTTTPPLDVLNEMMNTEFLTCLFPELREIVHRIQYDEYHLYPVDKHSLLTVQTLKQFSVLTRAKDHKLYKALYDDIPEKKLLLWGALFHDIGKGVPGEGHSQMGAKIIRPVLKRSGFGSDDIDTVSFLIQEHLFLIKMATRRDINDEQTALFCARKIKDAHRLKMLFLLTVSDAMSTGPKAWNDWNASLLRNLFLKVLKILEKGELASTEAVEVVENKKRKILSSAASPDERLSMSTILTVMSPRYLLYVPSNDVLKHIKVYSRLKNLNFVLDVEKDAASSTRTATICARNRPGLFSKIAGVLTLNTLNILDARIYTWQNNIALDIFKVTPPADQIYEHTVWRRVEENLKAALSGEIDLSDLLHVKMHENRIQGPRVRQRPHQIKIDNDGSSFFTIIEVFTYDFPGLLFNITNALFKCRLDVQISKIATKVDQVVDIFYVRDFHGQKIDSPDHVAEIKAAVGKVLQISSH